MQLLTEYFKLQEQIYNYFGYQEGFKMIPLDDKRNSYWMLDGEGCGGRVVWADVPFNKEVIEAGQLCYSSIIYTQRFLPKWVYRGENYTMISVDTQTDDNKLLMIFDNSKECKDEKLKELWGECWG